MFIVNGVKICVYQVIVFKNTCCFYSTKEKKFLRIDLFFIPDIFFYRNLGKGSLTWDPYHTCRSRKMKSKLSHAHYSPAHKTNFVLSCSIVRSSINKMHRCHNQLYDGPGNHKAPTILSSVVQPPYYDGFLIQVGTPNPLPPKIFKAGAPHFYLAIFPVTFFFPFFWKNNKLETV